MSELMKVVIFIHQATEDKMEDETESGSERICSIQSRFVRDGLHVNTGIHGQVKKRF